MSTIRCQRVVEQRFENIVEEIFVGSVLRPREPSKEVVRTCTPLLSLRYTKPALLLKKVEEDDLAQELLGEFHDTDVLGLEFLADDRRFGGQLLERGLNVAEQAGVLSEELFCNGFDIEGVFELCEGGEILSVL